MTLSSTSPASAKQQTSSAPDCFPAEPDGLGRVAFFGRTLTDYSAFYGLSPEALKGRRVLDVGAGSASFTAEASALGVTAVAVDPIYRLRLNGVREVARRDFRENRRMVAANPGRFRNPQLGTDEAFWACRQSAQDQFLADFSAGTAVGRYRAGALPHLDFEDGSFDLVLCGHFLFLYAEYFSPTFHLAALRELLRVSRERVLIYPLRTLRGDVYEPLPELLEALRDEADHQIETTTYGVLRGSHERLELFPRKPK